jgi:hypothetical protein
MPLFPILSCFNGRRVCTDCYSSCTTNKRYCLTAHRMFSAKASLKWLALRHQSTIANEIESSHCGFILPK